MANIGEVIPPKEEDEQATPAIGTAITSEQVLRPNTIQAEVMKTPQWGAMKDWIKKPENLMTTLVFLASMAQNRRPGQSSLAAFGERAVGTMAFRHGLGASQREEVRKQEEENRKQAALEAEAQHRKEQISVGREQVAATRENTAADRAVAEQQILAQAGMNAQDNETKLRIAEMQNDLYARLAMIEKGIKEAGMGNLFGNDQMKAAIDLYGASLDSDTPLTIDQAVAKVMRPQLAFAALSGDPRAAQLLTIFDKAETPSVAVPAPTVPPATRTPSPSKPTSGKGRPLTPAEQRQVRTREEAEALRRFGSSVGAGLERFGTDQNRPKEKF